MIRSSTGRLAPCRYLSLIPSLTLEVRAFDEAKADTPGMLFPRDPSAG